MLTVGLSLFSFFFNDTVTTEIYTLSLHDALPIFSVDGHRLKMFKFGGENKGPFEYFGAGRSGDPAQEEYERTADKDLEIRFHASAGTHVVEIGRAHV